MGYYVRALPNRKSAPRWKLQFFSQKKEFATASSAKAPRRTWDIPKGRWSELGFRSCMTGDQARCRAHQLNAQRNLKRHEENRLKFEREKKGLEERCAGFLPDVYREEFEQRYFSGGRLRRALTNRELSHWRAAQQIILEIQLEPSDWYDEASRVYDWFFARRLSPSYVVKIVNVLNLWGFFVSRKLGRPFFPIPKPRGLERARLIEAYFAKRGVGGCQSDALLQQQLAAARSTLEPEHFNWLFISVWLGLRPLEIDQLKDPKNVRVMPQPDGSVILWVYQSKIASVPPRYRWKLIPVFLDQQREALAMIEKKAFRRPLVKTVRRLFGTRTSLYGGRKGFTDLMLSYGQDFFDISQWMGHSTIERTWRNYKSRIQVHHRSVVPSCGPVVCLTSCGA